MKRWSNEDADRREISRHPPRARLSRLPRAQRERPAVRAAAGAGERRHHPHRKLRHAAHRSGERLLFRASAIALFRRRQDRPGSGGGLRQAQGLGRGRRPSTGWRRIWVIRTQHGRCTRCLLRVSLNLTGSRVAYGNDKTARPRDGSVLPKSLCESHHWSAGMEVVDRGHAGRRHAAPGRLPSARPAYGMSSAARVTLVLPGRSKRWELRSPKVQARRNADRHRNRAGLAGNQ